VYGSAINADTKAQIQVGGIDSSQANVHLAHRFRAGTASALQGVRFAQRGGSGYSAGTGGAMRISVQTDDGTGRPSGAVLASVSYVPGNPAGAWTRFDRVAFPSPPTLTKGQLYDIVFENTDAHPRSNYSSVNETFVYGPVLNPRQPAFADADYAVLTTDSGAWQVAGQYTADMDLDYADGSHDGNGYYQVDIGSYATISGGSDLARERFTVSGTDRTVTSASIRVRRSAGASPLVVQLASSSGAIIDSVNIPASSVPASAPGGDTSGQVWITATFAGSHVLTSGSTYDLRLSTASGTTYTATPVREGSDIGFGSFVFRDGSAQHTTNGSTWTELYLWGALDFQFYLK
jgi:hypothetical protein